VDVHTVGAGGGSIAWRDAGGALRVGPRSAGADPGPACYGRGGEQPTVTDANLLLGYLDAESPLAGGVRLDRQAAERAVDALGRELGLPLERTAAGIARVASAEMAQAVRVVTVERGIDPRDLALVPFGGAGPLHAAQIADELGIRRVVVPNASGVLSALGLVVSERRRDLAESVLLAGDRLTRENVAAAVRRLGERGLEELGDADAELRAGYDLRYAGQAFELTVPGELEPDPGELRRAFDRAHDDRYGYADPEAELELVTVRVAVALPGEELQPAEAATAEERGTRPARFGDDVLDAAVLGAGEAAVDGPVIFELPGSTLVVPPGWRAEATADAVSMERA
jgi:N-methylhydantoinase A